MGIRRDEADKAFSDFIRLRDGKCRKCNKQPTERADGLRVKGLEVSHFFGRRRNATRYDEDNCFSLCHTCHRHFTENPHEHSSWVLNELGPERYDALVLRANKPKKKKHAENVERAKELLKGVLP